MFETLQLRWRDKQKAPAVKKVPGVCQPEVYLEHFDSSRFQPGYPSDASENVSSSGSKVKQVPWKFTRRSAGGRELVFVCIWNGYRALHKGIEQSRSQEPGARSQESTWSTSAGNYYYFQETASTEANMQTDELCKFMCTLYSPLTPRGIVLFY